MSTGNDGDGSGSAANLSPEVALIVISGATTLIAYGAASPRDFDATLEFNYTKFYIGLLRNGQVFNFVTFRPKLKHLILSIRLPETEELTARLEASGVETQPYNRPEGAYRLRLIRRDVAGHRELLTGLLDLAYQQRRG